MGSSGVLRRKFIVVNAYLKREKYFQVKKTTFIPKETRKRRLN